jgi:hypothetical protein
MVGQGRTSRKVSFVVWFKQVFQTRYSVRALVLRFVVTVNQERSQPIRTLAFRSKTEAINKVITVQAHEYLEDTKP